MSKEQFILDLAKQLYIQEVKSDENYLKPETQRKMAQYAIELAKNFYEVAFISGLTIGVVQDGD